MLPLARLGVGPLLANPLVGYVAELRTTGRRSGLVRSAPVNYAIIDGAVYCLAGWGHSTHWFVNLRANPHVELHLPGSTIIGHAEEVTDPAEARRAIVRVARNAGIGLSLTASTRSPPTTPTSWRATAGCRSSVFALPASAPAHSIPAAEAGDSPLWRSLCGCCCEDVRLGERSG
jgi:deazaflavin-dependent oxidoreductase (nitroreductase family)